jgi:hypothetical protein
LITRTSTLCLAGLFAAIFALAGCRRGYDQSSPQAVLQAAKLMVAKGDADRLPDLIYADSKKMRQLLDELGVVLGSLQDLGRAVQKAYPDEIEKLKKEAEASAKNGEATSFISRMMGQASQQMGGGPFGRRNKNGQPPADPDAAQKMFNNAMKELFADPYGWIAANETRLTVQSVADDRAALLWDGKPALGIGLAMQRGDDDKWYLVLPTSAPGFAQVMPRSEETWEIMGSLMDVFDNMLKDLAKDVKTGKARRLDDVAKLAGEKAFLPAVLVFVAYGKAMEAEKKAAKTVPAGTPSTGS